jgi:FMN-dependent NADH-azoreductase
MLKILYVEASPRKSRSASIEVAAAHIARLRERHPDAEVRTMDVWALDLPEFAGHIMEAKYAGLSGAALTDEQRAAWDSIDRLADPFKWADHIVLAVPLWNFGIPYKLKHLIDVVSQKDVLFTFTAEEGLKGMLRGKKATVVYARGLDFSADSGTPAHSFDFQKPYMEMWLRFIGVTDMESIIVEKTIFGSEVDMQARAQARITAMSIADRIW